MALALALAVSVSVSVDVSVSVSASVSVSVGVIFGVGVVVCSVAVLVVGALVVDDVGRDDVVAAAIGTVNVVGRIFVYCDGLIGEVDVATQLPILLVSISRADVALLLLMLPLLRRTLPVASLLFLCHCS